MSRHLLLGRVAATTTMLWGAFLLALPARADVLSGWSVRDPQNITVRLACDEPWRTPQLGTMHDYDHVAGAGGGYLLHLSEMQLLLPPGTEGHTDVFYYMINQKRYPYVGWTIATSNNGDCNTRKGITWKCNRTTHRPYRIAVNINLPQATDNDTYEKKRKLSSHELGHGLGLGHWPNPGCHPTVMQLGLDCSPFYYQLTDGDKGNLRSLYGP